MERFTKKTERGNVLELMYGGVPPWTASEGDGFNYPRYTISGCAIDRLAAYEDTGLSPEEIVPDKHGKWLPQILLGQRVWDCSECKTLGSPHWKRCHVCEAKMDLQDVTDINVGDKPVTNRNGLEDGSFQNGNNHDAGKDWPPYLDLPRSGGD